MAVMISIWKKRSYMFKVILFYRILIYKKETIQGERCYVTIGFGKVFYIIKE